MGFLGLGEAAVWIEFHDVDVCFVWVRKKLEVVCLVEFESLKKASREKELALCVSKQPILCCALVPRRSVIVPGDISILGGELHDKEPCSLPARVCGETLGCLVCVLVGK